ncbi:MAG: HAD hydrolase-like protein [Pirellulales bacterium]
MLGERPGRILPGALTLLESLSKTQASLSLLTGNTQRGAHMKLRHYGIGHYFHGGVFGDHHSHRVELGQLAQSTISQQLNRSVHPDAMIIIGDTTLDIDCARTIGCRVLAVATGGNRADELVNHGADWVVDDLTHPQVLEWLLEI